MTSLTGLFTRASSYYLRVVLPAGHPAKTKYRNGRLVLSLGRCGKREAINKGTILRAEILRGGVPDRVAPAMAPVTIASVFVSPAAPASPTYLREMFDKWVEAKPRSADTVAACKRALALFEEQTGTLPSPS